MLYIFALRVTLYRHTQGCYQNRARDTTERDNGQVENAEEQLQRLIPTLSRSLVQKQVTSLVSLYTVFDVANLLAYVLLGKPG
jgi:hypothetical protein